MLFVSKNAFCMIVCVAVLEVDQKAIYLLLLTGDSSIRL